MGYPIVQSIINWFYFPNNQLGFDSPIRNTRLKMPIDDIWANNDHG